MNPTPAVKEELVYKARFAEQIERNDDLLKTMKEVVKLGEPLSIDERNLFSLAFKNVALSLRSSFRTIDSIEQKMIARDGHPNKKECVQLYREKIQAEMDDLCKDVEKLIDEFLLPKAVNNPEMTVFLKKMKGDYYRYLAEVCAKLGHVKDIVEKCGSLYKQTYELAKEKLHPVDPVRLGAALNYSVFFYEIANDSVAASQLGKEAFNDALTELDDMDEQGHNKDAIVVMHLIRDNLSMWNLADEQTISFEQDNDEEDDTEQKPITSKAKEEEQQPCSGEPSVPKMEDSE